MNQVERQQRSVFLRDEASKRAENLGEGALERCCSRGELSAIACLDDTVTHSASCHCCRVMKGPIGTVYCGLSYELSCDKILILAQFHRVFNGSVGYFVLISTMFLRIATLQHNEFLTGLKK